ncbi:MAG: hypothetical protein HYY16_13635 [Planctomycetes bacterium]|nr:hypothetical protein [Planctomycetota bacterium]
MKRAIIASIIGLTAATAHAQDVVRLRSGKHLCGRIRIDQSRTDGFTIVLSDTHGAVFVGWTQIPESERRRLQNHTSAAPAASVGDAIPGIRVITPNREVVGVLTAEDPETLQIKTAASGSPLAVPKTAVLRREDVKILEIEAYTPDEMIARRATGELTPERLVELGHFARALKQYAKAKEFYTRASEGPGVSQEDLARLIGEIDMLIRESEAEDALAAIARLEDATSYAEAIEAAQRFLADFAETEAARQNKDLLKRLETAKSDFEANRDRILAQRIPELWRSVRSSLWSKYADRRYALAEARAGADGMDEEIVTAVMSNIKCTQEEIDKHWAAREQRLMTASMGAGSWIYKGGQDGGADYTPPADGDDPVDDFRKRFGSKSAGQKSPDVGRKLQTSEEWWAAASTSERLRWLQCYTGLQSAMVKKVKEEERDCSSCRGAGTLKASRGGRSANVVCPRCHGAKKDVSVTYW